MRQLREERGWRPTYLAVEADIRWESIYRYERDCSLPCLETFCKICKALGVTTDEFLKGVEFK
ncbi:MAG: helix-turn-helix transcriptional regulator [Ruminococcus sp.]|nr:helix-turn-helix transcriptional regulator [Ruminococcus sp.]